MNGEPLSEDVLILRIRDDHELRPAELALIVVVFRSAVPVLLEHQGRTVQELLLTPEPPVVVSQ